MNRSVLFLLAVCVFPGCINPPEESAEDLQYRKCFEAGRRSELKHDVNIAEDTYRWLIGRGSRYGEYGLALLLLSIEPDSLEAVKLLLACAKRSSHTSSLFPDSAMDSAFSAAAMDKLSDIAQNRHYRKDIADSLRRKMSDIVTEEVNAWADALKKDEDSARIYANVISAVKSCRQSRGYVKAFEWDEISKVLSNEPGGGAPTGGVGGPETLPPPPYSVVKFVKIPGATPKYDFEVRLNGNGTFKDTGRVESDLRCLLMNKFLAENPHDGGDDVRILIIYKQLETKITGTADVVRVSGVRLEYDDTTGRGKIAVRIDGRNVSAAKEWARKHIEELASEKNIVLVAGKPPPPGVHYKSGSERKTEDGLLEIEFTTRPNNLE